MYVFLSKIPVNVYIIQICMYLRAYVYVPVELIFDTD